ncbi:phage terminase, large subunit, PBSX family [Oribacterium sp. oral taxon 078 str. F0262]|uniref:PBSX family phage terminase large subunit n=1 Tax=Oribacterium sp. oral taxon 078 TaxID=652706 RepID=UPI0001BCBE64|nr:PBSX family phage terminase large subunit [Oribacterium sp. oral taxon 078]EFE91189.1 phage terminase, large subunit, PBSX family [Oribacterium sp. oral taxon 078 str. F0262]
MELSLQEVVGKNYVDFWNTKKRYRVCKGSRGSKKSKTTALNMIYRLYRYPESSGLCVRRYANTLRDSVFSDLKWAIHRLQLDAYFDCLVSPLQIVRRSTGQKILFRGLDESLKITSISVERGCLCFVWIEEAYEVAEDDFNKLDMSIRGEVPEGYFKQLTLTFNPWSATSWLKARFFDAPDDTIFTKTTTWQCNEWLDDADRHIFEMMRRQNPRRYRIEGDGEWGIAEGLIYPNHRMEDFDVGEIRAQEGVKAAFNLDFGFTDPNAFVCELVDGQAKKIYIFDEWYQSGVTNRIIAETIKEKGYGGQRIICDCAEPKSIAELQDEGIRAEASLKGRDSVQHGIQLIQNYEIIVHPRCTEFYKEIENYCWEKDRNGRMTDKPDHEFSHGMDSMRYGVARLLRADRFSFD